MEFEEKITRKVMKELGKELGKISFHFYQQYGLPPEIFKEKLAQLSLDECFQFVEKFKKNVKNHQNPR